MIKLCGIRVSLTNDVKTANFVENWVSENRARERRGEIRREVLLRPTPQKT